MIGRGDDHGIDRGVVQGFAEVLDESWGDAALGLGHAIGPRGFQAAIGVAEVGDAAIGPLGEGRGQHQPAIPQPHDGQREPLIGRGPPNRCRIGQNRQPGSDTQASRL